MGESAETICKTPTLYLDVTMQPGTTFTQDITPGWNGFFYVHSGSVQVQDTRIEQF
jgi:redox-sensitive bicupin YhaK (pirin superfamily)